MEEMTFQQNVGKFSTTVHYMVSNFSTKLTTPSVPSSLVVRYREFWQGYNAPCHHHLDIHGNLPLHDCDYPMILCPGQKIVLTDGTEGLKDSNNTVLEHVQLELGVVSQAREDVQTSCFLALKIPDLSDTHKNINRAEYGHL
jgi:hypothetical protein